MAAISPYLDDLLTRWIQQSNDLRKEATFQKELLEPLALAASGNKLAMRERHRRDLERIEEGTRGASARWEERLQRIELWRTSVADLKQDADHIQNLIRASVWLKKARDYQETFVQRLERRADVLRNVQQTLHEKLAAWHMRLQEEETDLQELNAKREQAEHPLFVSRARKQPIIDFVKSQMETHDLLGMEIHFLRKSLNHTLGRLRRAYAAIEEKAAGQEILYEVHKQEILAGLKGIETTLQERREQILSDALVYEACRSSYRRIQNTARSLRCIEDIPQGQKSGWRKFFTIH